ncbi:MAG: ERF family protein [Candidatus Eremiobacteraeota bacterium]|nr:ERF family protein [Candidatus Eremiobacteraeota bacterium]
MSATSPTWLQEVAASHPDLIPPLLALIENLDSQANTLETLPFVAPEGESHSRRIHKIARDLAKAQLEFAAVAKDHEVVVKGKEGKAGYSYTYADLADVLEAVRPALNKHGISVLQPLAYDKKEKEAVVTTILMHKSGQWIRSEFRFPSHTLDIQNMGSLYTYMRRYSLTAMLAVCAREDDDDGEAHKDAARRNVEERRERQQEKQERQAEDVQNSKQFGEFWKLAKGIFATEPEVWNWFQREGLEYQTANDYGKAINRLKKQGEGAKESRPTAAPPAKEPAPTDESAEESKQRQAAQQSWAILATTTKGLTKEEASWWAGQHHGWVYSPEEGRPSARATPIANIRAARAALVKVDEAGVEAIKQAYAEHLEDLRLANEAGQNVPTDEAV